ncbi:MAG: hypothetical protein KJ626_00805 [Verrucomicrobia bacterium]|nr:hypothetical protein [Verrucomicrobiota bacterium]
MTPNPIRKVLSTLRSCEVRHLLMGGQACVFYGAAEFSRDTDIVLLAEPENLDRLRAAMDELRAELIAVPELSLEHLKKGHAVHFRCQHPDAEGIRIDIMSVLRGVDPFENLWGRRTTVSLEDGDTFELLALEDLVQAKKTQRDKDWPMLRRLIEAHYEQNRESRDPDKVTFWLSESRTPEMLMDLCARFPALAKEALQERGLIRHAIERDSAALAHSLRAEEDLIREEDRRYWEPLLRELEALRHRGRQDRS